MTSGKPTQAVPRNSACKGAPDGVNNQARDGATGGSDAAAPYPNPHTGKSKDEQANVGGGFLDHGGQSQPGYHGAGRLGKRKTARAGNANGGSGDNN